MTTLVVIKTHLSLQMLNGDDLYFFRMADSATLETNDFLNQCCINFVLPLMELKHVFDPSLVQSNERRSRNQIKVHQLLSSTLLHIKPLFQQIYNFKPFAQIKINFYLSVLTFVEQYIYIANSVAVALCTE